MILAIVQFTEETFHPPDEDCERGPIAPYKPVLVMTHGRDGWEDRMAMSFGTIRPRMITHIVCDSSGMTVSMPLETIVRAEQLLLWERVAAVDEAADEAAKQTARLASRLDSLEATTRGD